MGKSNYSWGRPLVLLLLLTIAAIWWIEKEHRQLVGASASEETISKPPPVSNSDTSRPTVQANAAAKEPPTELIQADRHKQQDIENMKRLHAGLMAFKEATGEFPAQLTDLVPDHVDEATLRSPREGQRYSFEFLSEVFRDGRT